MRTKQMPIVSDEGESFMNYVVMLAYVGFAAFVGLVLYWAGGLPALTGMIVIPAIGSAFVAVSRATKHPRE